MNDYLLEKILGWLTTIFIISALVFFLGPFVVGVGKETLVLWREALS